MKKAKQTEKLTELAEAANQEDDSKGFMDPTVPVKKKRGRPPKIRPDEVSEIAEPIGPSIAEQLEQNKNLVRPLFKICSDAGVKYAGTRDAEIDSTTLSILVDSSALCIHQYLPDVLGRHAALITLSVTFTQWGLRVYMLRQQEIEKIRRTNEAVNTINKMTEKRPDEPVQTIQ
jgi:hypothetical protein